MRQTTAKNETLKRRAVLACLFLVAWIPRVILCMQTVPVRTLSDELATISGAAYFAGLDWSAVISNAGYYGSGFSALFAPLFLLTDNPFVIYKGMLIGASVFQALIAPISFHLFHKYFKIKSYAFLIPAALACSFMVVTRTTIFYNEHILIFISWLVAWLLCILAGTNEKKKKRIYTLLLLLVLGYGLTIHTRALTYWIALVVLIAFYGWIYRKWLVSPGVCLIGGGISYLLGQEFIQLVQQAIWRAGEQPIRNEQVVISPPTDLFSLDTWQAWFSIVFGQLNTISAVTGGFILLAIALAFWVIWKGLVKRQGDPLYVTVLVFFTMCCGATIFAQSFSWLNGVMGGIAEGYGTKAYGMKAVTYVRYFGPYVGPVFLCGLAALYHGREKIRPFLKASMVIYAGLTVFWVVLILPYIQNSFTTMEAYMPFAFSQRGEADMGKYLLATGIPLMVFIGLAVGMYKRKWRAVPVVLAIFLFYQYAYNAYYYDAVCADNSMKLANGGYTFVKKMEREGEELPEKIYVVDRREKKDHFTYYEYQILLNRYQIQPGVPEESEEAMVFCNRKNDEELLESGYVFTRLDKNEYLYVKGEALCEMVVSSGKTLKDGSGPIS